MKKNIAFIDWQNLHLWTTTGWWIVDPFKLKIYLKDKYNINKTYYFLWYLKHEYSWLYTMLKKAWFTIVFKKQSYDMGTNKKWNIDTDLIFNVMEKLIEKPNDFDKIILISWDWDFKILIDYLIKKERLLKILFPNKKYMSSLYKKLQNKYFDYFENLKFKLEFKKTKNKELP
jgi:hypothetical protein